jgi:hypothetical protein
MMAQRIELDFIARRKKISSAGIVVLIIGVVSAYWTFSDYQDAQLQSELLDLSLSRYQQDRTEVGVADDPKATLEIQAAALSLSTPWSALLNDLEQASGENDKDIALLQVAPDRIKRQVRITAEARSLPAALAYVETLQNAATLRHPMLENHEVRTADRQRPVRFEITAEWSLSL